MSNTLLRTQNEQNNTFKNTLDNLFSTRKELAKANYYIEQKEK